jgi:YHS domain-containing protein
MLIFLVRNLLLALLIVTVLQWLVRWLFPPRPRMRPEPRVQAPRELAAADLKKDPVCGTYVAETTSVKATVRGEVLHFCSKECRAKYLVE